MQQSRLVKNIRELSKKEREQFKLFVESPYFNKHKKTIQLLRYILKHIDAVKGSKLSKIKTHEHLFPEQKFDEQNLYNTMSYLMKLFHRYLAIHHFEEADFEEPLMTLKAAYEANQFELLKNRGKQLEKQLKKRPFHNSDYFMANYRLNSYLGYYDSQYEDRTKTKRLQSVVDSLDRYYILEKLRNTIHLTANVLMMNTPYSFHMLDEVLSHLQNNFELYEKDISIIMYHTILMSLRDENNPEHYRQLKEMLSSKMEMLSSEEQSDLYSFANNYCVRQINKGHSEFQRELFDLYKHGLDTGIILYNGLLSEWNYKNITALGCSLKEFDWTENFIQEFKKKLPNHRAENAYNYNLAHLYYSKKMYQEALSALLHVQFTDVKYHLNTTFLLLRTYYALHDTEALLSLIDTFRIYVIRNQKITSEQKRGYTNFLRFAKRLVLLRHNATTYSRKELREKLDALFHKIEETGNIINRYWLTEECKAVAARYGGLISSSLAS